MNFSDVLNALNGASTFELYRIRAAINVALDEPSRMQAIYSQLQVGQSIEYFEPRANAKRYGKILALRRKAAVIIDRDDGKRWLIEFASINLGGADVQIRQTMQRGLGRNEIAVGQIVGYIDRNGKQRSGQVIRLNDKTVSLMVGDQQWRVAYCFLHHVLEGEIVEQVNSTVIEHDVASKELTGNFSASL
jgi:hypothetical protein